MIDQPFMLLPTPPMSNTQRQRLFRQRHPGYYGRLHARRRCAVTAQLAAQGALAAQMAAAAQALVAHLAKPTPLMLPAPVEVLQVPGINIIPQMHSALREYALLSPSAAPSPDQALAA